MIIWRNLLGLLAGGPSSGARRHTSPSLADADLARYGSTSPGTQRIVKMVARQLEAAGVSQPLQWRTYRAFVLGYVDALADLHACNGGKRPAGPESRAMSASVLRTLCGGSLAEALTGTLLDDLAAPEFRSSCEFALGRRAALDDYDHWSERDMSGIQTFIQAAHAELLQLVVQPDFEPASIKVACKAPIG